MNKRFRLLAALLALVLFAAACGDDDDSSDAGADDSSDDAGDSGDEAVDQTQGGDLTFHMITHSDDGPFWSVVKKGMEAACSDVGVTCVFATSEEGNGEVTAII